MIAMVLVGLIVRNGSAAPGKVVVLRGAARAYAEATHALIQRLAQQGHSPVVLELPTKTTADGTARIAKQLAEAGAGVIAAAGAKATTFALEHVPHVPVVFFMVPNALDRSFLAEPGRARSRITGVTTDIRPEDAIDWMIRLHGKNKKIGILYSERTRQTFDALRAAASRHGVEIAAIRADRTAFPKAIAALNANQCDSALMLPDFRIYNHTTIRRLLLWGLRHRKAVWAFSASVVKAGALGGEYTDKQNHGRQAAELVHRILQGEAPDRIGLQYPQSISRAINERTAEMIGLTIDPKAVGPDAQHFGDRR